MVGERAMQEAITEDPSSEWDNSWQSLSTVKAEAGKSRRLCEVVSSSLLSDAWVSRLTWRYMR
jgi:hypothetical protein